MFIILLQGDVEKDKNSRKQIISSNVQIEGQRVLVKIKAAETDGPKIESDTYAYNNLWEVQVKPKDPPQVPIHSSRHGELIIPRNFAEK